MAEEHPESPYGAVVFSNVAEFAPTGNRLLCQFSVPENLVVDTWDWVGLYPVGWSKSNQYYTYQYVKLPLNYEAGKRSDFRIVFPAKDLPEDDGEHYQFLFRSYKQGMCGASIPFQFKTSQPQQYVEEESEGMLVVRPKVQVLEEQLQAANQTIAKVTKERDAVHENLREARREMDCHAMTVSNLKAHLKATGDELQAKNAELQAKAKQVRAMQEELKVKEEELKVKEEEVKVTCEHEQSITLAHDGLVEKVQQLERQLAQAQRDKAEQDARVQELAEKEASTGRAIKALCASRDQLLEQIKDLQSTKDQLSGQNQSLTDELDTYKDQVVSCQTRERSLARDLEEQSGQLAACWEEVGRLTALQAAGEAAAGERERVQEALRIKAQELDKMQADKERLERRLRDKSEELSSTRDMMAAMEVSKVQVTEELTAFQQTFHSKDHKIMEQENEIQCLRQSNHTLSTKGVQLQERVNTLTAELADTRQQLTHTETQLTQLRKDHDSLTSELRSSREQANKAAAELSVMRAEVARACGEREQALSQMREFEAEVGDNLRVRAELQEARQELEQLRAGGGGGREARRNAEQRAAAGASAPPEEEERGAGGGAGAEAEAMRQEAQQDVERMKELVEEMEASHAALKMAHVSLTKRLEAKDRELDTLRQAGASVRQVRKGDARRSPDAQCSKDALTQTAVRKMEVEERGPGRQTLLTLAQSSSTRAELRELELERDNLRARLEQGTQEYKKLSRENQRLKKQLSHDPRTHEEPRKQRAPHPSPPEILKVKTELLQTSPGDVRQSCRPKKVSGEHPSPPSRETSRLEERKDFYKQRYAAFKEEAAARISAMQKEADVKRRNYETLARKSHATIHSLRAQLAEKELEIEALRAARNQDRAHKAEGGEAATELEALRQKLVRKSGELESKGSEVETLSAELERRDQEIASLQRQLEQAYANQEEAQAEAMEDFQGQLDAKNAIIARLKRDRVAWETSEESDRDGTESEDSPLAVGKLKYGNPYNTVNDHFYKALLPEKARDYLLEPEVTPDAKVASVAHINRTTRLSETDEAPQDCVFEDCNPEEQEENFEDAIGEGVVQCPQCQQDVMGSEFDRHLTGHVGRICPVCNQLADDQMSVDDFERHVNTCCDSAMAH